MVGPEAVIDAHDGARVERAADLRRVGIVVIGRNEAPRIDACLGSLPAAPCPRVYVDSGSQDGSPDIAEARGVTTLRLTSGRFTAARGRQTGLEHLLAHAPALQYVQFVDGDCVLEPGWLRCAAAFLDTHPDVGVVVGRLREQRAAESLLARLVNADWDLPTGEIDAIGGISLARVAALRAVNGWRIELIAGEELDLGARLRAAGWKLQRLADDMTRHDIGIHHVSELWRRAVRSGFAYAELATLHGWRRCRRWLRRALGNVAYGAILPVVLVVGLVRHQPLVAAAAPAAYMLLVLRVARDRVRRGDGLGFAMIFGLSVLADKFAGALGTAKWAAARLAGNHGKLIEYKAQPRRGS